MVMLPIYENNAILGNREDLQNARNNAVPYRRNPQNNIPINRVRPRRHVDNLINQYARAGQEETYSKEEILEFQRILRNYLEGPIGR